MVGPSPTSGGDGDRSALGDPHLGLLITDDDAVIATRPEDVSLPLTTSSAASGDESSGCPSCRTDLLVVAHLGVRLIVQSQPGPVMTLT